jgi:hypothetical protein
LKTLFDSLHVQQEDSRAVLVATLPTGVFRKLVDSPDQTPAPAAPATAAAPEKTTKSRAH